MFNVFRSFPALLAVTGTVSACSTSYQTINSTARATSAMRGSALELTVSPTTGGIGAAGVTALSGALTHNTGRLEISDGTYLMVDTNGFDAAGYFTNGAVTGRRLDGAGSQVFAGTYNYVVPVLYTRTTLGGNVSVFGNFGIPTSGADVPVRGQAQYRDAGGAFTRVVSANGASDYYLSRGYSLVDVDFSAASVDVTLGFFTRVNGAVGPTTAAPIDAVSGRGMQILGSGFVGGVWATYKNGVQVDVTGPNTTTAASGDFYGYDSSISAPDEVAGVMLMNGSTGTVYSVFMAD
jgi:hypothetical protein